MHKCWPSSVCLVGDMDLLVMKIHQYIYAYLGTYGYKALRHKAILRTYESWRTLCLKTLKVCTWVSLLTGNPKISVCGTYPIFRYLLHKLGEAPPIIELLAFHLFLFYFSNGSCSLTPTRPTVDPLSSTTAHQRPSFLPFCPLLGGLEPRRVGMVDHTSWTLLPPSFLSLCCDSKQQQNLPWETKEEKNKVPSLGITLNNGGRRVRGLVSAG